MRNVKVQAQKQSLKMGSKNRKLPSPNYVQLEIHLNRVKLIPIDCY